MYINMCTNILYKFSKCFILLVIVAKLVIIYEKPHTNVYFFGINRPLIYYINFCPPRSSLSGHRFKTLAAFFARLLQPAAISFRLSACNFQLLLTLTLEVNARRLGRTATAATRIAVSREVVAIGAPRAAIGAMSPSTAQKHATEQTISRTILSRIKT